MKLTLALEYQTLKPLVFLINKANVPESKICPEILKELKRRRITARDVNMRSSVQKYCSLAVLLVGITLNYGIREKKELQAFAD